MTLIGSISNLGNIKCNSSISLKISGQSISTSSYGSNKNTDAIIDGILHLIIRNDGLPGGLFGADSFLGGIFNKILGKNTI